MTDTHPATTHQTIANQSITDRPMVLACSECHELAVLKPPGEWTPAWGPPPPHSHWDGEALCAVMTRDGYRCAEPKLMEMQP